VDVAGRLDAYQRRHRWVGFPLAVVYKFVDDQGSYLTAMITYYGFLSLFPLLLLLVSTLGFALEGNPALQERVLDSALSRLPVIGQQIGENVHSLQGSGIAVVVGLVGSIYGSLGVVQAAQNAFNKVWAVPRNARPNPLMARVRSLLMLLIVGVGVLLSTALSGVTVAAEAIAGKVAAAAPGLLLNLALFVLAFRLLTAARIGVRQVLPGAIVAAVGWQLLQWGGTWYFGTRLTGVSATYGVFGVVIGLLVWLYLSAFTVVLCAEVNAVRANRLWPRSLLTPFTDNVRLTRGDREAYESYAETERHKGFETVDVDFDQPHSQDDDRGQGSRDGRARGQGEQGRHPR
jgi:YihY family inner membrane protein